MKKWLKRMGTGLLLYAVILLSACGKEQAGNSGEIPVENSGEIPVENSGDNSMEAEGTEYAWLPEYREMGGGEWTSFQDIRFAGDSLYYEQVFFDVVNQANVPVLKQYSLTEGRVLKERDVFWRDSSMQENYLVSMERVEAAQLPEKTRIVIGFLGSGSDLRSEVAAFNRQSERYCVSIRDYTQKDGTRIAAQAAADALSVALATGINCPDILALDQMEAYWMDLEAIAGNGAFADLAPFLAECKLFRKEDFLENALDSCRYHGRLVGIPCYLSLRTVAGNASDLGEEPGWNLEEMMAYAAAHPGQRLFDGAVREGILEDCLASGMDSFLDRESGQCFFDTEEFGRLLAFAGTFPEEYDPLADDRSTGAKIQAGEVLLSPAVIDSFYRVQEYQVMFDGSEVYIGYLGPEGTGCIADCRGALGISAQSPHQQAAWEFLEYHLERQADNRFWSGFSTRKSSLDRQMEEAATVSYYLDEEGNPLLDAEGRPVPKSLGGVGWSFEELISFRTATEEEVHRVRELIENARPARALDEKILDIIREEAEPFFQGQKPVEDVTGIIQSRVQLYLDGR